MEIISLILFTLSIIILSGLISCSEAALLSINQSKVLEIYKNSKTKKEKKANKILLDIKKNMSKYLVTIVILNNVVNILGSIFIGIYSAKVFSSNVIGFISFLITFLIILFSEIIPKLYGEIYSDKISKLASITIYYFTIILNPLIVFFEFLTNILVIGKNNYKQVISQKEVEEFIGLAQKNGEIELYEKKIISNVFNLDEKKVSQAMIFKKNLIYFDIDSKMSYIIKTAAKTGYTRFPILNKNKKKVLGTINIKDILKFFEKPQNFSVEKILREPLIIKENTNLKEAEKIFKNSKSHIAIVLSKEKKFLGIITFEDVIEKLIGEIEDEFDIKQN